MPAAADFLPRFRRRLADWLQVRIASGRTPFRRVEETPGILTGRGTAAPDLVLWINRDSLMAGAMIVIPPKVTPAVLHDAAEAAVSLGLRRFVVWGARTVEIRDAEATDTTVLRSWSIPDAANVSTDDFAVVFEQLLLELKNLAVAAGMPPERLPPAYFANLCRQVLCDLEPVLVQAVAVKAASRQSANSIQRSARDLGWLTLWRLLALLWEERMPTGVNPERLGRAFEYALAEPAFQSLRHLPPPAGEVPLPESAAVRFHHLAGRLTQLGWRQTPDRAAAALRQFLAETARACRVATTPLSLPAAGPHLLVSHIPPQWPAESFLIAPRPCLAGLEVTARTGGATLPTDMAPDITLLAACGRPRHVVATLSDDQPPTTSQRRQRLAALRQPWPYRRFQLDGATPAWAWDALHLVGCAAPEGTVRLTLPRDWATAPGAPLLWRVLAERWALTELDLCAADAQSLSLVGRAGAPDVLTVRQGDVLLSELPLPAEDSGADEIAALAGGFAAAPRPSRKSRRSAPDLAEKIARRVFSDGLPRFPEHYLRRIEPPLLQIYQLPGPLRMHSHFFDRIRLSGPDGTVVECGSPAHAEALCLASRDGRSQVALPLDPVLTLQLTSVYRQDLARLWRHLMEECRRHHAAPRQAQLLARRLWQERGLPDVEER